MRLKLIFCFLPALIVTSAFAENKVTIVQPRYQGDSLASFGPMIEIGNTIWSGKVGRKTLKDAMSDCENLGARLPSPKECIEYHSALGELCKSDQKLCTSLRIQYALTNVASFYGGGHGMMYYNGLKFVDISPDSDGFDYYCVTDKLRASDY